MLAELLAAPLLPHVLGQQLGVAAHHRLDLAEDGQGGDVLTVEGGGQVAEEPGAPEAATADDDAAPFPERELGTPRGRQGAPRKRVVVPDGWLDDTDGRGAHLREDVDETTGG